MTQLLMSPDLFRVLFDDSSDGLFVADVHGCYVATNARGSELTGYSTDELIGMTRTDLIAAGASDLLRRKDGTFVAVEVLHRNLPDGRCLEILRDITAVKQAESERLGLESQLLQARKLESVGRLAGGVAHDFNNMLSVIIGRSELALSRVDQSHPVHADLAIVQQAAERSADLTRQLLNFARRQPAARMKLDLNDVIDGSLAMLRRIVGGHIDLCWRPGAALWPVEVDPTHVDQILANLVGNARDAIPSVGRITIATSNVWFDQADRTGPREIASGPYVVLEVADTGQGMSGETRDRLFEPFYTTKPEGHGTGLGLVTVHSVVRQAGGSIAVSSTIDTGTTFRIFLPGIPMDVMQAEPGSMRLLA